MSQVSIIAVVDDDEAVREATGNLVRSLGTSCLITDLQMPGLSGIDLQDHLIARGHLIPIIFITAYPDETVRARAMKAGAIGFMGKPYSVEHLIGCLDKALKAS